LVALTTETVRRACFGADSIYVCGGGARNSALMQALRAACAPVPVSTTDALGLPAQAVEAAAFAWLARERIDGRPAGRSRVTGARGDRVLGAIWPAHAPTDF
jgi:anhydro-N-acetylmuramic acid kinase